MHTQNRFKSAHELRKIAGTAASAVLPDEVAETFPIPKKTDKGIVIQILFYKETGPPNKRIVSLPHYAMVLDGVTGKVLRFWACRPEELDILAPLAPVEGAGIDPKLTSKEFSMLRLRFLDISAEVWEAFASGKTDVDAHVKEIIREYQSLFLRITKKEVAPFYVLSSSDFFNWLQHVLRNR